MKSLSKIAVMNVEKGEEIVGGWATVHIPQVGIYKFLAKRKKNNKIEWAHFVQRDSGLKEKVYRGEVDKREEFNQVLDIMNKHLLNIFGVTMQPSDYDMYTVDGKKTPTIIH